MNIVRNLCRRITRQNINILTQSVHETWETNFSQTGYNVYAAQTNTSRKWNTKFRPVPKNYYDIKYIPPYMDIDLVMSHTKFSQFQELAPIAINNKLPLISLEHTCCFRHLWSNSMINSLTNMRGDRNVFISDYSVENWGYTHSDPTVKVIHHGIDTSIFYPANKERKNSVLTVGNDYINRRDIIGYDDFCAATKGYDVQFVGDTKGLSEPAKDIYDLANYYQTHRIYLNPAKYSPIPMSLLEAAACGCAIISANVCGIPEYFTHKHDAILCNSVEQMQSAVRDLTNDEAMAIELGKNAANTIKEKFNINIFVDKWKSLTEELV